MTGWWWLFFEPPLSIILIVLFLSFYTGVKLFKAINQINGKLISKKDEISVVNTSKHKPNNLYALKISITPQLSIFLYLIGGLIAVYLFMTGYWFVFVTLPLSIIFFVLLLSSYAGLKLLTVKNPVAKHLSYHLIALAIAIFPETAWLMMFFSIDIPFIENTLILFSSGLKLFYGISSFIYKKLLFMFFTILYTLILIFTLQGAFSGFYLY